MTEPELKARKIFLFKQAIILIKAEAEENIKRLMGELERMGETYE
jgi:hypothetical protein